MSILRLSLPLLYLFFFCVSTCLSQNAKQVELESSVYQSLADMQISRDELLQVGFACQARGLYYSPAHLSLNKAPRVIPMMLITCQRSNPNFASFLQCDKAFRNFSSEQTVPVTQTIYSWCIESFSDGTVQLFTCPGEMRRIKRREYEKDKSLAVKVFRHEPFDDWLMPPNIIGHGNSGNSIQRFIGYPLKECHDQGSGIVKAIFVGKAPSFTLQHTVLFNRQFGGMPTKIEARIIDSKAVILQKYVSYGNYEWTQHNDIWLPEHMEIGTTLFSGSETRLVEADFYLTWKVGKEVPESCYAQDQSDPRTPLGKLFGFDFEVRDKSMNVINDAARPWTIPEVLTK